MANVTLDPYIFFAGTCREAMEFYRGVLSGELRMTSYDETPGDTPKGLEGKIMHAVLDGPIRIMASDTLNADTHGHGKIHLSLMGEDETTLKKMFEALSEDGEVHDPLQKQVWGDIFGTLTDRFGVNWMVNIVSAENAKSSK